MLTGFMLRLKVLAIAALHFMLCMNLAAAHESETYQSSDDVYQRYFSLHYYNAVGSVNRNIVPFVTSQSAENASSSFEWSDPRFSGLGLSYRLNRGDLNWQFSVSRYTGENEIARDVNAPDYPTYPQNFITPPSRGWLNSGHRSCRVSSNQSAWKNIATCVAECGHGPLMPTLFQTRYSTN